MSETDPSPANAEEPQEAAPQGAQEYETGPAVMAVENETQQTQEGDEPPFETLKEPPEDLQDGVPHEVVPSKALSEEDEEEIAHKPKSVPIWKLFRFSTPLDVVMIVVGVVMGVVSGVALPGHFLLFGEVINQFVYYTIATETIRPRISDFIDARNNTAYRTVDDIACNSTRADEAISMLSENGTRVYLCTGGDQGGAVFSEVLGYICDPADELQAQIAVYAYYYVAIALGVLLSTFLANALLNMSAYRQTRRMRLAFFRNVLHQEIGWFDVTDSAELSTRLADDIEKIQSGIGDKVAVFLSYFSTFVTGYVIAFTRSWKMALVVMTMLPLLATVGAIMSSIVASFTAREQSAYAAAGSVAEEVLSAIRTVVAFGGENKEAERYGEQLKKARNVGVKKSIFTATAVGSLYFIMFNTFALGFWYGSQLILNCELSAGDVVTVFFSVVLGSFSLGNALPEIQTFAVAFGAASAVFEVIDKESQIDTSADEGETPDDLSGDIEFRDVVFHYPARPDVRVLKGLSLKISSGQTVALVGPSGCGKSTTVQLIQRFYDTDDGQITIDGREIKSLNLKWLRSNIGIVSQEPVLFNMSIADNIRLGKEGVDMDGIRQAAKNANAHYFISALPNGYDTLVGERGNQLSGGQKQRIAIARALVRNPRILLLDEATSALDTESEKIVQEALDKARKGRTTIVIAHRLSTIQTADVITSIDQGQVVEWGTHSDLMDREGLYYELVTAQTIGDQEEEEEAEDDLAAFRAAVKRESQSRSQSTSGRPRYQSQHSTASNQQTLFFQRQGSLVRQDSRTEPLQRQGPLRSSFRRQGSYRKQASFDGALSKFSMEDIPVGAHPSPAPGRVTFGAVNVEAKFGDEEGVVVKKRKRWSGWRRRRSVLIEEGEGEEEQLQEVKMRDLLKLNAPDWPLVTTGVISSAVVGCLFPLLSIFFSAMLEIFGSDNRQEIEDGVRNYALAFVGLAITAGFANFLATFSLGVAGEKLTKRIRLQTFQAILRQEIGWFDDHRHSTGALTTRLAVDASEVKGATGLQLGVLLQTVMGFLTAVVIAFAASWELTLVLVLCFPVLGAFSFLQIRLQAGRTAKNKKKLEESGKTAVESIDNVRTVASLGIEQSLVEKYNGLLQYPFDSNKRSVFLTATVFAVAQSVIFFLYAVGYVFGAYLVVEGRNNYDDIFRTFAAVVFTALSLGRASSFAPDASKAQVSAARIFALFNRQPPIDSTSPDGVRLAKTSGEMEVRSVHFHYPTRPEVQVLQGLNVEVSSGKTLALVGPSGCGKSTIVSLLERFYDPESGSLTLDGSDLRDLNIRWLRSQVGIVSQEPVLFDTSIADNIRYGANFREVSDEEVVEAAKAANIHSFIDSLPQGYSTNVGSKGTQLSGGQKQRVAIARALVRNPKILLLDEATSALDTESEKIVQEALDKAREGRTSIVIAHRLSTIYNADKIAVIHNGKVIESGTHSSLMSEKGAYYHLNTVQLKDFDEY